MPRTVRSNDERQLRHPVPRPGWFNEFWYNNVAPIPGTSSAWAIVLANQKPYTLGTQQSGIARYRP